MNINLIKNWKIPAVVLACFLLGLNGAGCSNEVPKDPVKTTGSVSGRVVGIGGSGIRATKIYIEDFTAAANSSGYYFLGGLEPTERMIVLIESPGYVSTIQTVKIEAGVETELNVTLARQNAQYEANSENEITFTDNGGAITINADSLMYSDGELFSGDYRCSMTIFNSDDKLGKTFSPGDFQGYMLGAVEPDPLILFGFFSMNLYSKEEKMELQLRQGASAHIVIPIHEDFVEDAPATIGFWTFNESDAYWYQQGLLTKNDTGSYEGEVTHFSFFGAATTYTPSTINGVVIDCEGEPLVNARVVIEGSGNINDAWRGLQEETEEDGSFSIDVYPESDAVINVYTNGVLKTMPEDVMNITTPEAGNTFIIEDDIYTCDTYLKMSLELKWGTHPRDLDLILTIPPIEEGGARTVLSYQNSRSFGAELLGDVTEGNGSEKIILRKLRNGIYRFSAHHFAGENNISAKSVTVSAILTIEDFYGNTITQTFEPVSGGTGVNDIWSICDIEVSGSIIRDYYEVNQISKDKSTIHAADYD